MGLLANANNKHSRDTSPSAGSSNALTLDAEFSTVIDVFYDVAATTDAIKIEGSVDGSTWRELDETVASGSVTTGGDVVSVRTAYSHIRVYAGSSFANSDVNAYEIAAKGL